jgi:FkbM family methyltransferase
MKRLWNPRPATLPILAGRLRGCWWSPAAGGKVLRLFLGTYEPEQTALFCQQIRAGDVVFDIGANAGYYTLMGAQLVGQRGKVIACEPETRIAAFLRRHVEANRLTNVSIIQSAVGGESGVARFSRGKGTGTGRMSDAGDLTVRVRTLDEIAREHGLLPTHIKSDVEGAELDVLRGGQETLTQARPTIFLSTHGTHVHEACCRLLQEYGYFLSAIGGGDFATAPELLAA